MKTRVSTVRIPGCFEVVRGTTGLSSSGESDGGQGARDAQQFGQSFQTSISHSSKTTIWSPVFFSMARHAYLVTINIS